MEISIAKHHTFSYTYEYVYAMNIKLTLVLGFSVILVILLIWHFLVFVEITYLPENYELQMEFYGETNQIQSLEGDLVNIKTIDLIHHKTTSINDDVLSINSIWEMRDRSSNEITWSSELNYFVDRKTKKHVENYEGYFVFPHNVQKQNYEFFHPMIIVPATFVFEKEITKNDLELYVFTCDSKGNDYSFTYPQFAPKIVYSDITCEVWVEPITGQEVFFDMGWNNYFLEGDSKTQVEIGGDQITSYSTANLIDLAKDRKQLFYFYETLIPILLVSASVGLVFVVFVNQNLRTRTTELEHSKKEKFEMLGKLSANLAHDIRNPLTIIKISTEIIKRTDDKEIKDKQIQKITRGIQRIAHQVDDVLEYVGFSPLQFSKKSIREILISSYNLMPTTDDININFPNNDIEIECDGKRLERLFVNIFLNAVQAIGSDKGSIDVRINDKDDRIEIECKNSGPAIDEENLDKIFEPLFTTKMEGTGLGLSSVKSIIQAHNGTISVTSPPTIFRIELPKSQ